MTGLFAKFAAVSLVLSGSLQAEVILRIATWNLEWFPGRSPTSTLEEQAIHVGLVHSELCQIEADVFLFQELKGRDSADLAVEIKPGFQNVVITDFPQRFGVGQQVAVVTRLETVRSGWVAFASGPVHPPRGFAWALLSVEGRSVLVYSVHLKSNRDGIADNFAKREEAIRQLLAFHAAFQAELEPSFGKTPAVLGGDFNTDPMDERFRAEKSVQLLEEAGFRWAFEGVAFEDRVTCPAQGEYPDACFDHLFFQGALDLQTVSVLKTAAGASDHRPVIITLTFAD